MSHLLKDVLELSWFVVFLGVMKRMEWLLELMGHIRNVAYGATTVTCGDTKMVWSYEGRCVAKWKSVYTVISSRIWCESLKEKKVKFYLKMVTFIKKKSWQTKTVALHCTTSAVRTTNQGIIWFVAAYSRWKWRNILVKEQ